MDARTIQTERRRFRKLLSAWFSDIVEKHHSYNCGAYDTHTYLDMVKGLESLDPAEMRAFVEHHYKGGVVPEGLLKRMPEASVKGGRHALQIAEWKVFCIIKGI